MKKRRYSRPQLISIVPTESPVLLACTGRFDCSLIVPGCAACGLPGDPDGATCGDQCGGEG
jgi:hypothetical protein